MAIQANSCERDWALWLSGVDKNPAKESTAGNGDENYINSEDNLVILKNPDYSHLKNNNLFVIVL